MSQIHHSEVPGLQQRVNNALVNMTNNLSIFGQVTSCYRITENFYRIEMLIQQHFMIRALVFDSPHQCEIYPEGNAFRILILDPMTQDLRNAIKDYHAIGHAL